MTKFGGWNVRQDIPTVNLDIELEKVFRTATSELTGNYYEPLEFLGCRVAKGVDYRFLAYVGPQVVNSPAKIAIVTVSVDTDGNIKVTKTKDVFDD